MDWRTTRVFQFYKVRLKRCRENMGQRIRVHISILQSSIKTIVFDEVVSTAEYFNSTKFD